MSETLALGAKFRGPPKNSAIKKKNFKCNTFKKSKLCNKDSN